MSWSNISVGEYITGGRPHTGISQIDGRQPCGGHMWRALKHHTIGSCPLLWSMEDTIWCIKVGRSTWRSCMDPKVCWDAHREVILRRRDDVDTQE